MGVKLEKSTRERLKSLGKLKDRSPHWLVKKAIDDFLSREEQWEDEKRDDRERWAAYVETVESYSLDQVSKWMKDLRAGMLSEITKNA